MVIVEAKKALRTEVAQRITDLGAPRRTAEAKSLVAHLERWLAGSDTEVLLATLPLGEEPSLVPLLQGWIDAGHRVALAKTGRGRSLEFRYVNDLAGPWEPHPYGLKEPSADAERWVPGPTTVCLVPGVAFGPAQSRVVRLGRGAGYYDRWLAVHGHDVTTVAVGYSVQWVPRVPTEDHDQTLDGWAGPDGVAFGRA